MKNLALRPFTSDDVAPAGVLLSSRHARHRQVEPLLSASYEEPEAATAEVQRAWSSDGASGSVAESGGGMVGFLIGAPKTDETWGANVWVESAGQAVTEPEVIRDLYGHAASTWVEQGRTAHYTLVPSHDRQLVDAWFRLGFGQQHMHAIRQADMGPGIARSSVTVRPARRDDISKLAELELALPQHHGLSPVFSAGTVPSFDEARSEWEQDFEDPAFVPFVAEHSGEVIGSAIGCSVEKSSAHVGLSRPDRAGFLAFAAIFPQYRGLGAGRALGETVVRWAGAAGYPSVVTDWRVTNLLSSRTWPRLGFRDTFVRLHRVVGY